MDLVLCCAQLFHPASRAPQTKECKATGLFVLTKGDIKGSKQLFSDL